MTISKLVTGFLGLALAAAMAQAEGPTISFKKDGENFIVTYTGELYQSTDAVKWTAVPGATSPYQVKTGDKQLFFCAKGDAGNKNYTIPLADGVDLDMIWIKPGTFIMGSPEDELGRGNDEPQHEVTLTRGYWIGKYEVTQAQYKAVMGNNPSQFQGDDQRPVETVSFYNAIDFCSRLTAIEKAAGRLPEGYEYTLPTEAQWEYACRAGTTTALNNGMDLSDKWDSPEIEELAWCTMNSDSTTHPVGLKKPNNWGLYDMHGNLLEWCLDWYDFYPTEPVTDPTGPSRGLYHVIRGGSWNFAPFCCRSAYRSDYNGTYGVYFCGFRVTVSESKNITIPLSDTVNLDMIRIEPGSFRMGSPEDELGRWDDETQHQVTLTKGYWLGKYEVTQAQYETVMGTNPSNWKGADLPVEQVSWYDAMNFCEKLTEQERAAGRLPEGYEYTLPTEAQWEYACRAGTRSALNSGKNLSDEWECPEMDEVGWYWYNSGNKTHSVGQKQPNAWGLYDMHGNVFEWCLDWWGDYPTSSVTDPKGASTGSYRVMRGGCLNRDADRCRSASRLDDSPDDYFIDRGFRVALSFCGKESENKDMTIPLSEDVNMDMIWIEPGTFMMGSPEDENGRDYNETQHEVTLTRGYWIGKYEVTQAQYQAVMGTNPSYFNGADLPVEMVSWDDAKAFCKKLTELERSAGRLPEGYEYNLPTEAQWEYACRAGTRSALNSGQNLTDKEECPEMDEVGWYGGNSDFQTHPAGQKQPNAWGLYDMHGNVCEWCLDWYDDYPADAVTDPTGPDAGSYRILRGGANGDDAQDCRSAARSHTSPGSNFDFCGFRVALTPVK